MTLRERLKAAAAAFRKASPAPEAAPPPPAAAPRAPSSPAHPKCLYCRGSIVGPGEMRAFVRPGPDGRKHYRHFAHLACIPRASDGTLVPPPTQHKPESE